MKNANTFSFRKEKPTLADLLVDRKIMQKRYPQTLKLLEGTFVYCQCCGEGCTLCDWTGGWYVGGLL